MKNFQTVFFLICSLAAPRILCASELHWQDGRIVEVRTEHEGKVLYWIANTPVTKNNEVIYRISVHVKDKLYIASYKEAPTQAPPPKEWIKNHPVKIEVGGGAMLLQTPSGETLKLGGLRWKPAPTMKPIRSAEWGAQTPHEAPPTPAESMVGFSKPAPDSAATPSDKAEGSSAGDAGQTPAVDESPATVSVSSSPYLADVYVDGKLEGYTPTKLSLSPGKHSVRLEKQGYKTWATDVTLAAGSQSTVDATLSVSKR
jgi:hypothetical protein